MECKWGGDDAFASSRICASRMRTTRVASANEDHCIQAFFEANAFKTLANIGVLQARGPIQDFGATFS
jgi:hypothetical protein